MSAVAKFPSIKIIKVNNDPTGQQKRLFIQKAFQITYITWSQSYSGQIHIEKLFGKLWADLDANNPSHTIHIIFKYNYRSAT